MNELLRNGIASLIGDALMTEMSKAVDLEIRRLGSRIDKRLDRLLPQALRRYFDPFGDRKKRQALDDAIRRVIANEVTKRVDGEAFQAMADRAVGDAVERLASEMERRVADEIISRAFTRPNDSRPALRRLLRGAARSIMEREHKAWKDGRMADGVTTTDRAADESDGQRSK